MKQKMQKYCISDFLMVLIDNQNPQITVSRLAFMYCIEEIYIFHLLPILC